MSLISRGIGRVSVLLIGVAGVSMAVGVIASACALPGYSVGGASTDSGAGGASAASGSVSATVGAGGGGGGENPKKCMTVKDCGEPLAPCREFACKSGFCVPFASKDGPYPFTDQLNPLGDCNVANCLNGHLMYAPNPDDKPTDARPCTKDTCMGPYVDHSSLGPPGICQSDPGNLAGTCDATGICIECNEDGPSCPVCSEQHCVTSDACGNGMKDGKETAKDCGGPECAPCGNGKACAVETDCVTHVCSGGVCKDATCTDNVLNGGESDVDCGKDCGKLCRTGERCLQNDDCKSGLCKNLACQFTCGDGEKTGLEEGVDCGGPICPKCIP